MNLPFSVEQFFEVFKNYNSAIQPAQIAAYLLGIAAVWLAVRRTPWSGRVISGILGLFWIWIGIVYHIVYFSPVNPATRLFGLFHILQGLLFILVGTVYGNISFRFIPRPIPLVGAAFVLYAMALYSILGWAFGHRYPSVPLFGVAPCPTTIFTFGLLLWASTRIPLYLLVIPTLWSLVGATAAFSLKIPQDYGLLLAGVLGTTLILIQNRGRKGPACVFCRREPPAVDRLV